MDERTPNGQMNDECACGPAARRLGLGWRLGLLTTLVVAGVMAVLSGAQIALELRTELRERRAEQRESLAPLVTDLGARVYAR